MAPDTTFDDISVGDHAEFTVLITPELVEQFSLFSGDLNPLHMDETFAATTPLHARVAHGMIVGALFSRLLGMHLPGKGCLYLSQTMQFRNPIFLGTNIAISGEITHKSAAVRTLTVRTLAQDTATKEVLVTGEAVVKIL
jgi:phosphate acetyltransferase/phosphate butyryltransferase